MHAFAAANVGPEWAMEKDEAEALAKAAQQVARHYDIQTTQKAIDWAALASALGWSYLTRLSAMALRQKMERAAAPADETAPAAFTYAMPAAAE